MTDTEQSVAVWLLNILEGDREREKALETFRKASRLFPHALLDQPASEEACTFTRILFTRLGNMKVQPAHIDTRPYAGCETVRDMIRRHEDRAELEAMEQWTLNYLRRLEVSGLHIEDPQDRLRWIYALKAIAPETDTFPWGDIVQSIIGTPQTN